MDKAIKPCEQQCGAEATVYAGGPKAGDWAGHYCQQCADAMHFIVFNKLSN